MGMSTTSTVSFHQRGNVRYARPAWCLLRSKELYQNHGSEFFRTTLEQGDMPLMHSMQSSSAAIWADVSYRTEFVRGSMEAEFVQGDVTMK